MVEYLFGKKVDSRVVNLVEKLAELKVVQKAVKMVVYLVEKKIDPLVGKKVGN